MSASTGSGRCNATASLRWRSEELVAVTSCVDPACDRRGLGARVEQVAAGAGAPRTRTMIGAFDASDNGLINPFFAITDEDPSAVTHGRRPMRAPEMSLRVVTRDVSTLVVRSCSAAHRLVTLAAAQRQVISDSRATIRRAREGATRRALGRLSHPHERRAR